MRLHLLPLLLLFVSPLARADEPAKKGQLQVTTPMDDVPEPPPAPLEVEEPAPAPIKTEKPSSDTATTPAPAAATSSPDRPYRIAAWTGVGMTLAFVVSGTVLGVLAQHNSDELQRETHQLVDGKPPVYDDAQRARYTDLMEHGVSWNRATIACFIVAGVTAVTSGLLFWDATRRASDKNKLSLRPTISTTPSSAQLILLGRF